MFSAENLNTLSKNIKENNSNANAHLHKKFKVRLFELDDNCSFPKLPYTQEGNILFEKTVQKIDLDIIAESHKEKEAFAAEKIKNYNKKKESKQTKVEYFDIKQKEYISESDKISENLKNKKSINPYYKEASNLNQHYHPYGFYSYNPYYPYQQGQILYNCSNPIPNYLTNPYINNVNMNYGSNVYNTDSLYKQNFMNNPQFNNDFINRNTNYNNKTKEGISMDIPNKSKFKKASNSRFDFTQNNINNKN